MRVSSDALEASTIEKYREKCMKLTYEALESGEIYRV